MNTRAYALLVILSACGPAPTGKAYYNRGDPENLLAASTELVHISLVSRRSVDQLSDMVSQDPPARATIDCRQDDPLCKDAKHLLDRQRVVVRWVSTSPTAAPLVTLMYDRVVANNCENRYLDNSSNVYNLNHPTFGCSVTANTVQMVSDKRQFATPTLLDFQDGEKAAQTYGNYLKPPAVSTRNNESVTDSIVNSSAAGNGGR